MGVGLDAWRASIGQFVPRMNKSSPSSIIFRIFKDRCQLGIAIALLCAQMLVGLLLLSGDVEVNPGPGPRPSKLTMKMEGRKRRISATCINLQTEDTSRVEFANDPSELLEVTDKPELPGKIISKDVSIVNGSYNENNYWIRGDFPNRRNSVLHIEDKFSKTHFILKRMHRKKLNNTVKASLILCDHPNLLKIEGVMWVQIINATPILQLIYAYEGISIAEIFSKKLHDMKRVREFKVPLWDQMNSALDYMDMKGMTHGDLKPHNVVFKMDKRNQPLFKIIDYESVRIPSDKHTLMYGPWTAQYMSDNQRIISVLLELRNQGLAADEILHHNKSISIDDDRSSASLVLIFVATGQHAVPVARECSDNRDIACSCHMMLKSRPCDFFRKGIQSVIQNLPVNEKDRIEQGMMKALAWSGDHDLKNGLTGESCAVECIYNDKTQKYDVVFNHPQSSELLFQESEKKEKNAPIFVSERHEDLIDRSQTSTPPIKKSVPNLPVFEGKKNEDAITHQKSLPKLPIFDNG